MKERKLGLLGRKVGMTRVFTSDGRSLGVTVVELGPNTVLKKNSKAKSDAGKADGYTALQLGFGEKDAKKLNKAQEGSLKKAGGNEKARLFVKELRVSDETLAKFEVGADISLKDLEIKPGDLVDIAGVSKGKGFAGVFKRYHFGGHNATHGTHEYFRHPGTIGNRKWPGRVMKGRKMPGHMGDRNVTTQNVQVVEVRAEENVLLVLGAVPGAKGAFVTVRPAIKKNPLP